MPLSVIPAKAGIHSLLFNTLLLDPGSKHYRDDHRPFRHSCSDLSFLRKQESMPLSVIPAKAGIHALPVIPAKAGIHALSVIPAQAGIHS